MNKILDSNSLMEKNFILSYGLSLPKWGKTRRQKRALVHVMVPPTVSVALPLSVNLLSKHSDRSKSERYLMIFLGDFKYCQVDN